MGTLLKILVTQLLDLLTPQLIKTFVNGGLTALEDIVKKSPNTIDDTVVLPIINTIRAALSIPHHV